MPHDLQFIIIGVKGLMHKTRVNLIVFNFEHHLIASVCKIQQIFTYVCRRTNNYFVALSIKKHVVFFTTGTGPVTYSKISRIENLRSF
jgi:hypothetical protein